MSITNKLNDSLAQSVLCRAYMTPEEIKSRAPNIENIKPENVQIAIDTFEMFKREFDEAHWLEMSYDEVKQHSPRIKSDTSEYHYFVVHEVTNKNVFLKRNPFIKPLNDTYPLSVEYVYRNVDKTLSYQTLTYDAYEFDVKKGIISNVIPSGRELVYVRCLCIPTVSTEANKNNVNWTSANINNVNWTKAMTTPEAEIRLVSLNQNLVEALTTLPTYKIESVVTNTKPYMIEYVSVNS